ncbi:MAG: hypothetical protein U9N10_01270 [Bacillota bacterium]|nr:hypothetical protein [Bacillota bacterium]
MANKIKKIIQNIFIIFIIMSIVLAIIHYNFFTMHNYQKEII